RRENKYSVPAAREQRYRWNAFTIGTLWATVSAIFEPRKGPPFSQRPSCGVQALLWGPLERARPGGSRTILVREGRSERAHFLQRGDGRVAAVVGGYDDLASDDSSGAGIEVIHMTKVAIFRKDVRRYPEAAPYHPPETFPE